MNVLSTNRFINRDSELATIQQHVATLDRQTIGSPVLINFHGIPGLGKTALIKHIYALHQNHPGIRTLLLSPDIPDLDQEIDFTRLKFEFIAALFKANREHLDPLAEKYTSIMARLGPLAEKDDSIEEFSDQEANSVLGDIVQDLLRVETPLLLLFDGWDQTLEALFVWVERLLLLPLIRTCQLLGVFGSQLPLRWHHFEIRRLVEVSLLLPFSLAATSEHLNCSKELARQFFAITSGLPYANQCILEYCVEHPRWKQAKKQHLPAMAQHVYMQLSSYLNITPEIQQIFSVIAFFREFNGVTLRQMLPVFFDEFANRSETSLNLSISHMFATRAIAWSDAKAAYHMDETIRAIFSYALRMQNQNHARTVHRHAMDYYIDRIQRVPEKKIAYVIEYIYHLLWFIYSNEADQHDHEDLQNYLSMARRSLYQSEEQPASGVPSDKGEFKALLDQDQDVQSLCSSLEITPARLWMVFGKDPALLPRSAQLAITAADRSASVEEK
jgi:hypothetical protein